MPAKPRKHIFKRVNFEAITHKEALTLTDILALHKKGLLRESDYLFTLEGLKKVAYASYRGAVNNSKQFKNIKTDHFRHSTATDANSIINEAFTT